MNSRVSHFRGLCLEMVNMLEKTVCLSEKLHLNTEIDTGASMGQ